MYFNSDRVFCSRNKKELRMNIKIVIMIIMAISISCSTTAVKKDIGGSCKNMSDCKAELICKDSTCQKEKAEENDLCDVTEDCKTPLICSHNICQKEMSEGDSCSNEVPCKENLSCYDGICYDFSKNNFKDMKMLDFASSFKFYTMSDNKGDSIEVPDFEKMINWTKKLDSIDRDMKFVIGLGDHVKKGRDNKFISFMNNDNFYHNNFYPNIADGENEYYGDGQDDWGAGKKLFKELNLLERDNVTIRENGAEYYAKFTINGINIHLIQLHFPDQPSNIDIAWPKESREYMINKIKSIEKSDNDIIIVAAHSRDGAWYDYLTKEQLDIVMSKVDIGFSATIHIFERITLPNHNSDGTLFINTGSITNGYLTGGDGYLELHVLKNPTRVILQYIDMDKDNLGLNKDTAWIKYINGKIEKLK